MVEDYSSLLLGELEAYARNESGRRRMSIIAFERDNAVKHAYSLFLKSKCFHTSLRDNHVVGRAAATPPPPQKPSPPFARAHSFVWVAPSRLLGTAYLLTERRRAMRNELRTSTFSRSMIELHYERLQVSVEGEMARVLPHLGVSLDAAALRRVQLEKSGAEDLSTVLLNFGELADALSPWPCLRRMLHSAQSDEFSDECAQGAEMRPGVPWPPVAKSMGDVVSCGTDGACTLVAREGFKLEANVQPEALRGDADGACSAWHRKLCTHAARRARELDPGSNASSELCVLP